MARTNPRSFVIAVLDGAGDHVADWDPRGACSGVRCECQYDSVKYSIKYLKNEIRKEQHSINYVAFVLLLCAAVFCRCFVMLLS